MLPVAPTIFQLVNLDTLWQLRITGHEFDYRWGCSGCLLPDPNGKANAKIIRVPLAIAVERGCVESSQTNEKSARKWTTDRDTAEPFSIKKLQQYGKHRSRRKISETKKEKSSQVACVTCYSCVNNPE